MAVIARYQVEGSTDTYPTLQQAQMIDALLNVERTYDLEGIVEALDKHFIITPRALEEKDETL